MNKTRVSTDTWLHFCRSFLFAVTFIFIIVGHALAQRAIPDNNLAYPVLVTIKISTKPESIFFASGFYLNTDRAVYFVTAKHVLADAILPDPLTQKIPEAEVELLSYSKDLPSPKPILLSLNLSTLRESGDVRLHPSQDVAVVRLATAAPKLGNSEESRPISFLAGVTPIKNTESGVVGVPLAAVKIFDQVLVGNDALMYGYPRSLGIEEAPQYDIYRPLLRKALVAGQDTQRQTIILDGPSYHGNSGGPVFQIERDGSGSHFYCIGIDISHIPLVEKARDQNGDLQLQVQFNSGYAVVEPMDFVLELINEGSSKNVDESRAMETTAKQPGEPRVAHAISFQPPMPNAGDVIPKQPDEPRATVATSKQPAKARGVNSIAKQPSKGRVVGTISKQPSPKRKTPGKGKVSSSRVGFIAVRSGMKKEN